MNPHLFVDISCHGFGHLGTSAPVLNRLRELMPSLRLTVRSGLPATLLRARLGDDFTHIDGATDIGFVQKDAVHIDHVATRLAYERMHEDLARRVTNEAEFLARLAPDVVLTNVAYLPLAGAKAAGIPALSICSLNWADMLQHFYGDEAWARSIIAEAREAYAAADLFIALTPSTPMTDLPRKRVIGPVATIAAPEERMRVRRLLTVDDDETLVLVAMGGFDFDVPVADWPRRKGLRYLLPSAWNKSHPAAIRYAMQPFSFGALLRAADAVLTKPGYGTFAEAACSGVPLLYLRREDWPEQDCLIPWFRAHGRCAEVNREALMTGAWVDALDRLLMQPRSQAVVPTGNDEAAKLMADHLERGAGRKFGH